MTTFQKVNICEEESVDLFLNGKKLVTFMCTLQNLKELTIGHLYSRNLIKSLKELSSVAACEDMRQIYAITSNDVNFEGIELNTVLASSCGSGTRFSDKLLQIPKVQSDFYVPIEKIKELAVKMFSKAEMYKHTGGMHCASISDHKRILAMCEDVGRHNAIDKVIGKGLLRGVDFNHTMIITTGRISFDMVLKAANISCPLVVSRSIPTTMALRLAKGLGINIIGRAISRHPMMY